MTAAVARRSNDSPDRRPCTSAAFAARLVDCSDDGHSAPYGSAPSTGNCLGAGARSRGGERWERGMSGGAKARHAQHTQHVQHYCEPRCRRARVTKRHGCVHERGEARNGNDGDGQPHAGSGGHRQTSTLHATASATATATATHLEGPLQVNLHTARVAGRARVQAHRGQVRVVQRADGHAPAAGGWLPRVAPVAVCCWRHNRHHLRHQRRGQCSSGSGSSGVIPA
jgi:hypothetical protein